MTANSAIRVPGTYNFRDVGGYAARDGRIRSGVLFRSDALQNLTDEGRAQLSALQVHTIIDLRDAVETSSMPDALAELDVDAISLPVFEGSGASQATLGTTLEGLYEKILTQHAAVVVDALRRIAEARPGATIVHCTAGKDRTGIVVALALLAVGVDREIVIADYAATEANLAGEWFDGMVAKMKVYGLEPTKQMTDLMGTSPADALSSAIDRLEREHGSVRQYLLDSGLSLGELADLENVLVERDQEQHDPSERD